MDNIDKEIEDKAISLWSSGYRKSDILKHLKEIYPNTKLYWMKISRIIDEFQPNTSVGELDFTEIDVEMENIKDWLNNTIVLDGRQNNLLDRKFKHLTDNIRKLLIQKSKNEIELENTSIFLQIDFSNQVIKPLYSKYDGLREDILDNSRKFFSKRDLEI